MAFPAITTTATTVDTATATSTTVVLPSGIASGDLLLIAIYGSATDASPNTHATGWTVLSDQDVSSAVGHLATLYRIADGSEGSSVTVGTDLAEDRAAVAYRITGWHGTAPPEVATGSQATTGNPDPPSLTPSWGADDTLWIAVVGEDDSGVHYSLTGYPTSYALSQTYVKTGTSAGGLAGMAGRQLNAASEDPGTFTLSGSSSRTVCATIAVRPAAGGGGGGGALPFKSLIISQAVMRGANY